MGVLIGGANRGGGANREVPTWCENAKRWTIDSKANKQEGVSYWPNFTNMLKVIEIPAARTWTVKKIWLHMCLLFLLLFV